MKYYDYENFKNDTRTLIQEVKEYKADVIVGIARGGLTLAQAMAEALEIRNVQTLRTESYDGMEKRDKLSIFSNCEFANATRVLVVDDIADSGQTLQEVMKKLEMQNKQIEFKSCTLFYKKTSVYEPHFWINETNEWIEFFWEKDFKL